MPKKKTTKKKVPKKTKKKTPKKSNKKVLTINPKNFDIDKILFLDRQVFLFGVINTELSTAITKQLLTLQKLDSKSPVIMWINSPGGSISDGLAIVDTMKGITPPVLTVITGEACSMGGVISVCGDKRYITPNAVWMAHDGRTGMIDYFKKIEDRLEMLKILRKQINTIFRDNTKLSDEEILKATNGELWYTAKECQVKGIVDMILEAK